jgi:hypothetical protein
VAKKAAKRASQLTAHTPRKKTARKKTTQKPRTIPAKRTAPSKKKSTRRRNQNTSAYPPELGNQSGDLQGLSRTEQADSESVSELVDEGNAFEADVVAGVERADETDEEEVHTHEVPEDDVPEEYLERDE